MADVIANCAWCVYPDGSMRSYRGPGNPTDRATMVAWLREQSVNATASGLRPPVRNYLRVDGRVTRIRFRKSEPLTLMELRVLSYYASNMFSSQTIFSAGEAALIKRGLLVATGAPTEAGKALCARLCKIGGKRVH